MVGTVASIHLYPVRSMAGVDPSSAEVGPAGLAGDRAATVIGDDGRAVRGKEAPPMRAVRPTGDAGADAGTLSELLGRPVRIVDDADAPAGQAAVHLVSTAALARAAAGEVPDGCSAEDPRANLVLELSGEDDERTWVGSLLRIGDVVLEVTRTPKHCLGIYAEVRRAGRVSVGDAVRL
ncbi:MAG: uncharacterized protein QOC59_851 [Microbacteriaceae bacterium]|nr:uncharacterized protein [Microbacteriaceae bacterium]